MKKILTFIVFIAALTAIIYVYFNEKSKIDEKAPLYNAIPNQFPVAIESANWTQLLTKLDTLSFNETINQQDWYVGAKVNLDYINNLKLLMIDNNQKVNLNNGLIAYGNAGNSRLGILLAISVNDFDFNAFEKLLKTKQIKFTANNFDSNKILSLKNFNDQSEASLSYKNGILLFSFQASFIEEAIISLNQPSLWPKLVKDLNQNSDAYLYLNAKSCNYLSSYLLKPKYFSVLNKLDAITNNAVYQLDFFSNEIILNGYSSAEAGDLLEILNTGLSKSNDVVDFLPSNTALYTTYSRSDALTNATSYISNNISEILNEQYASFILESYNEQIEERNGLIMALNDVVVLDYLKEIDKDVVVSKKSYNFQIYESSMGEHLNESLHLDGLLDQKVFFSVVDEFLIVSSNLTVVEQFINRYLENDFLKFDKSYAEFKHSFSKKSNLDIYVNLEYLQAYLSQISTENTWQSNISMVDFQFSNLGDLMFSQGKINLNKSTNESTKVLWSTNLDTISSFRTQLVINHNNNETEIMTQDDAGNLYLFSKSGKLIWKIKIADLILSEIYQIDYYNNDKYQYIFNTENKIYVIDRNGDNVDGFPLELPGKASNEMLVVNYDNAGVYRYFVASHNGNVYGYEQNGSPLDGWNPKTNVGVLTEKIKHEMVDGLDYIYFSNNKGDFSNGITTIQSMYAPEFSSHSEGVRVIVK